MADTAEYLTAIERYFFVLDDDRRMNNHYAGFATWLEENLGLEGERYVYHTMPRYKGGDGMKVVSVQFFSEQDLLMTQLRWG